ncbi:MAG: hypothetical protein GXO48_08190, partial [Chlorobi bacterium]|nr:hypothetical protein [Chlorobiota bacterium]
NGRLGKYVSLEADTIYGSGVLRIAGSGGVGNSYVLGNLGVGLSAPLERLHVNGNVRFSGALMPGGNAGSSGQVLISQGPNTPPVWGSVPIYIDYNACTSVSVGSPDGPHTTYCPEGYVVVGGKTDGNDFVWEEIVCCPLVGVGTQNYSTKPVWGHLHPP